MKTASGTLTGEGPLDLTHSPDSLSRERYPALAPGEARAGDLAPWAGARSDVE